MTKLRSIDESPERLFVIGDLHGCPDETRALLDFLKNSEGLSDRDQVIFVGDYIDRGPDSKGVIDLLIEFQRKNLQTVFLKGNHEDMLLEFLGYDGRLGHSYIMNGGAQFLQSYGLAVDMPVEEILESIPPSHISFLLNLDSYVEVEPFVVAHAGLNPLRDLKAQLDEDLFWIRDEFISNIHYFRRVVIFGHTPYQDIMFHLPYKIGIDTGLVFGNKLTCIEVLQGHVYQIEYGEQSVRKETFQTRNIPFPLVPDGTRPLGAGRKSAPAVEEAEESSVSEDEEQPSQSPK